MQAHPSEALPAAATKHQCAMDVAGSYGDEAFVTFGRGLLKVFNAAKNFGFISPVFKNEDSEGPPLPACTNEGLWFFGNHSLPNRAVPGLELSFEIWENSQGKAQARRVRVAIEPTASVQPEERARELTVQRPQRLHPNEPRVIYPSVYVSDVPVEWNEDAIRKLHQKLGLNPDTIMGLKFLPFTEVSLGVGGKGEKQATPVTGAVILRYLNEEAANAGVERLKGHPIQTSTGQTKHLGAKHATPPKWVVQRRQDEEDEKKQNAGRGEALLQKVTGVIVRVSMAGYGVIKSAEWGEVMWRQYELPTNLRTLQFADKAKFQREVEGRDDYRRLKEMEGKEVEAELYKLPDGQLRASHVRIVQAGMLTDRKQWMLEDNAGMGSSSRLHGEEHSMPPSRVPCDDSGQYDMAGPNGSSPMGSNSMQQQIPPMGPPGMPPAPGMPPGVPPGMDPRMGPCGMMPGMPPSYMDPNYHAQMMQAMHAMHAMHGGNWGPQKKEKKKDKKDKRDKRDRRDKRRYDGSSDDEGWSRRGEVDTSYKRRKIDDNDF